MASTAIHFHSILISLPILVHVLLLTAGGSGVHCHSHESHPPKKVVSLKQFALLTDRTLKPTCAPQKPRIEKGAAVLEMKHSMNWNNMHHQDLLTSDDVRVRALQSRMKNAVSGEKEEYYASEAQIPVTSGLKVQTLNYIVTVELGGKNATVIMDTGSDITWVQCQPCKSCYTQQDPLFDPSLSPTFRPVLCNSSTCNFLQFATGYPGACDVAKPNNCRYVVNYGDGSYTRGELGRENLNFGNTTIQDFVFGCGRSNHGLFGGASGLIGLGRSQLSLISQTATNFGGVFSYCLPATENKSGSLVLGRDWSGYRNETPISYTRMISNPQMPTFYFLNFTGASVGGVPVQSTGFAKDGTLIDSGTVITRLVPSVYKAIRDEFLKQFSMYPPAPGYSILDTCFNFSAYKELEVPTVELHFEGGVDVRIDVTGVFYFVKKDASQVCLALASLSSEDEMGIIGNYQQKNLRVFYDTQESKLGFAEENCSYV